ncbi:hypothetical protein [Rhodococcoides fascians]|uniref:hypothetical protein n=1 Tax=Rhodococcoides fascians TaxID=1828 RepID=UPI00050BF51B|nr:hypothetical protein [Rhodococcus fascians]
MRQVRNIVAMCALVAATTLGATACGSEAPTSTDAAPVTSAAAAPSANGYSDSDGGSGPGDITQAPDVVAPAPEISTAAGTPAVPPAPNRDDVNVDARDFEQPGGQYFFQSPSGNVFCGFSSFNAPGTIVGCQVRYSVPGNTGRECANTANNTYGVKINQDDTVEQICTNQGIFVGDPNNGDTQVLQYGQVIGVTGAFCRSTEAGITCYSGDSGFMISRDVNIAF